MGLDISFGTDNNSEVFNAAFNDRALDYFKKYSLSRTFCNFMCRPNVIGGEPELDQIGRITSVDITPVYEMNNHGNEYDEELEFLLEVAESEEEKQEILTQAKERKESVRGNIDKVTQTISNLIAKLSTIDNLPDLLNDHGHNTLDYNNYFTDFNEDKGEGYIGNNFGQDLRNFKRFLEYAKSKNATTVYFQYG